MKKLYECILERLYPLRKARQVNHIDLWNNQDSAEERKTQKAIRRDAIFIEFIINEVRPIGMGVKDKFLTVRFHFSIKNLRSNKVEDLDFYEDFVQLVEGFSGNGQTEPIFGAFHQTAHELDEDHGNASMPYLDYDTVFRDISGYFFKNIKLAPDSFDPDVTTEIV